MAEPLTPGALLDGVVLDDADLTRQDGSHARLLDCALTGCVLDDVLLAYARVLDTTFTDVRANRLDGHDSTWRDVTWTRGRVGALLLHGAEVTRLTLVGTRLDYLDLRGAKVHELRLSRLAVRDLDLAHAEVANMVVEDSRVDRLDVTESRLRDADLRGAELAAVDGVAGLAGATVGWDQLVGLAPLLAAHLRITVEHRPSPL